MSISGVHGTITIEDLGRKSKCKRKEASLVKTVARSSAVGVPTESWQTEDIDVLGSVFVLDLIYSHAKSRYS